MEGFKKISLYLIGFLFIISSCSSDDDGVAVSNDIKLLTGYSKIVIIESTAEYDGASQVVEQLRLESDGASQLYLIVVINEEQGDYVGLSVSDDELDGNIMFAELDGESYFIEDFEIIEVSEDARRVEGLLAANREIVLNIDIRSFGNGTSTIEVKGSVAVINGHLGSRTYNQLLDLNEKEPQVNTILLQDVPGSLNDAINMQTGRLIREAGYTTQVNSSSEVFSGGVDLFCSGKRRIIESGATLGVHSWCCGENGEEAVDIPKNDPQHQAQVDF